MIFVSKIAKMGQTPRCGCVEMRAVFTVIFSAIFHAIFHDDIGGDMPGGIGGKLAGDIGGDMPSVSDSIGGVFKSPRHST